MILVIGATGSLGGLITRRLLAGGERVRILIREGSAYEPLVEAGAEAVRGDLKEAGSLAAACVGIRAIISTATAAGRTGEDTFATVDDAGNRNLIDAAVAAGVVRFVFVSALGSNAGSPVPLLHAKGLTEDRLRAGGLSFTILQPDIHLDLLPAMLFAGPVGRDEAVTIVGEGRRRHSFVSRQDVAAFVVATLDHPAAINKTILIGGAEATSWRDLVAQFERELGRPIRIETIALGEPVPGLPPSFSDVMTALEMYDSVIDMSEVAGTYGVQQTLLHAWVRATCTQRVAVSA